MTTMTAIQRVRAVLAGDECDRPPVSFWYHFGSGLEQGPAALDAHLAHLDRWKLDFLKIMNDNPYPASVDVRTASDLSALDVLDGESEGFAAQLELVRSIRRAVGDSAPLIATVFNAWAVLRRVVIPRAGAPQHPPKLDGDRRPPDVRLSELLQEDRRAVGEALEVISDSLANFARACIHAGANGIFLSVRDDWVNHADNDPGTYDDLLRAGDRRIIAGAGDGWFNLLHVCGVAGDFGSFADYPVHAINWADRAAGPAIGEVIGKINPVVCGGVDNLRTLPDAARAEVEAEVADAIEQAAGRPLIVAPGCTFDPAAVPEDNLRAMLDAVRSAQRKT